MTAHGPERERPSIPLNEGEHRALVDLEAQLRREDPALAGLFGDVADEEERGRRHRLARRLVGIGLLVIFIGLVAQEGVLSIGAIVLSYGVLSVVVGSVLLLRHRFLPSG